MHTRSAVTALRDTKSLVDVVGHDTRVLGGRTASTTNLYMHHFHLFVSGSALVVSSCLQDVALVH